MSRFTLILTLFFAHSGFSKTVSFLPGETDLQFVERVTQSKVLDRQIDKTKKLTKTSEAIVAFTESHDADSQDSKEYDININVFLPLPNKSYQWVHNLACEIEGGSATLRAFFYANADQSPGLEIGVICGWDSTHVAASCPSNDQVRFFQVPTVGPQEDLPQLAMKDSYFYKEQKPDSKSDFTCTKSKFSNAADVKKILRELGFR